MIPRIFHQIWVGDAPFPDEFKSYQETWRRHHPEWELRLWTEDDIPADLERREVYERLRVPAERADILRFELLHRFGGVYLDTDFECRQPIDPLIDGVEFFAAELKPGRLNNAVIGSTPGHPILERAIRDLRPLTSYAKENKRGVGPLFFDALVKEASEPVKLFPPESFYPSTPAERDGAVAIHHAARTWQDAEGFRKTALRAEERLAGAQRELERAEKEIARLNRALGRRDRRQGRLAKLRRALPGG